MIVTVELEDHESEFLAYLAAIRGYQSPQEFIEDMLGSYVRDIIVSQRDELHTLDKSDENDPGIFILDEEFPF